MDKKSDNPFAALDKSKFPTGKKDPDATVVVRRGKSSSAPSKKAEQESPRNSVDESGEELFERAMSGVAKKKSSGGRKVLPTEPPEPPRHSIPATRKTAPSEKMKKNTPEQPAPQKHVEPNQAPQEEEDIELFGQAMSGVAPIASTGGRKVPPPTAPKPPSRSAPEAGEAAPLQELVEGTVEFQMEFTEEYQEGHVLGLDPRTVIRLKAGTFSPEGHLDLHGCTMEQAYAELVPFLRNSYLQSRRCVLLIPGRGKNSPDQFGVLRERIQAWLTRDPFKRVVLAFCSAQPKHGGTGALYVLLRKFKKSRGKIQWDRIPLDIDLD
jgi:DNA-nicking Smr family endonuclease